MRVFITGATGFLGSHIAETCMKQGHEVLCLYRKSSILPCWVDSKSIRWISFEDADFEDVFNQFAPEVLIHSAWGGVSAADRNNPKIQENNVVFSKKIVELYDYKQIIALGSQDEYGFIDEIVDELHPLCPLSEYAKAKINFSEYLRSHCEQRKIEWQWIRVFSMYGSGQAENWLIPSVVVKCLNGSQTMETTKGEQRYSYLYVNDFARGIVSIIGRKDSSGIYNISASNPFSLREIFEMIRIQTGSSLKFEFGALPYRPNQSMMICGNAGKFKETFGEFELTEFSDGLRNVVDFLKKKNLL